MDTNTSDIEAFLQCYARWSECVARQPTGSRAAVERQPQRKSFTYGRKNEEFIADFQLVARRTLSNSPLALRLFVFHFLMGADIRLCAERLKLSERDCKLELHGIAEKVGRAFRTVEPYPLFPVQEYFGTMRRIAR